MPDFPPTKPPDAKANPRASAWRPRRRLAVHHEGRRQGLAVRPGRPGGRPAADPLRAVRVAGPEPGLPRSRRTRWPWSGTCRATPTPRSARRTTRTSVSTYRLTEHHLSGMMSRWLPWLAELMPELFCEISPGARGGDWGSRNTDWVRDHDAARVDPGEGAGDAAHAAVRLMAGKTIHHVGLPWHWGYKGVSTGRRGQRPVGAGRRPERDDPRGEGVRVQRPKGRGMTGYQSRARSGTERRRRSRRSGVERSKRRGDRHPKRLSVGPGPLRRLLRSGGGAGSSLVGSARLRSGARL